MTTKQIKDECLRKFNISNDYQQLLYHIYEDNDFSFYLDRIKKFVKVEKCDINNAILPPYYHYEVFPKGEKQRTLICDFACALMNYASRALSLEKYDVYSVAFGFGRRLLKSLI